MSRKRVNTLVTLAVFAAVLAVSLISPSCSRKPLLFRKAKPLLDTFVVLTVASESDERAGLAIEHTFSRIEEFGEKINFYSEKSELSFINANAGVKAVRVSPDTLEVIAAALSASEKSGGAYDATIGPVMQLWDFHGKTVPVEKEIRKRLRFVGYRNVVLDRENSTVFLKKKGMLLDLGGIAKGYAADLAVKDLKEQGIDAGIVAIAGDIRVFGQKPDGKEWKIGVKNPRQQSEADEIIAKLGLRDRAISTSGDYERFFIRDGVRFHHLLDPKTGYPAGDLRSVSVIAGEGAFADALSTAAYILGREKGLEMIREQGMEAILVDSNGTIITTPGLEGGVEIEKKH